MNQGMGLLILLGVLMTGHGGALTTKDIGLDVKIPKKWELTRYSKNTFYLGDTTGNFTGLFSFTIYEDAKTGYDNARDWAISSAQAYTIWLESHPCYGVVYQLDTMVQNGLFGMFVNGENGDCEENITYRKHHRFVANGNFGYELAVDADSLDMVKYYLLYIDLLDGVKIDRQFNTIIFNQIAGLNQSRINPEQQAWADFFTGYPGVYNKDAPAFTRLWVEVFDAAGKNRHDYTLTQPAALYRLGMALGRRPEFLIIRLRVLKEQDEKGPWLITIR